MNYSVAKLKNWRGREGAGYQGELLRDGKVIGWFHHDGNGGDIRIDFYTLAKKKGDPPVHNREEEDMFYQYVETLPDGTWPEEFGGGTYKMSGEMFIVGLMEKKEAEQRLKRQCAKNTLFRLKDEPGDAWYIIKMPWSDKVKAALEAPHQLRRGAFQAERPTRTAMNTSAPRTPSRKLAGSAATWKFGD